MSDAMKYSSSEAIARSQTRTLFSQTMWYVAATAGTFTVGAYLGRNMSYHLIWVWFIAALGCLFAMRASVRKNPGLTVPLLLGFGVLMGLATSPTLVYYSSTDPAAVWRAGAATALFILGFGTAGYTTRRDLSALARVCFFALLGLIIAGIVLIFVHIPAADMLYSVLGLVIFAGLTAFDFQRLRRGTTATDNPAMLAASIFLDAQNVFLFFLRIFSRN